jgi:hypothetical protein
MDESALLSELKSLESAWGSLDHWLIFWIALVVVGVAMEVVVVGIEYRHERRAFSRGIIRPPDKPSLRLFVCGLLGAGLVAIGVAGEFCIHIKAGRVETEMRDVTGKLVAIANGRAAEADRQAGFAISSAADAEERAAKLEKDAEGLRKQNLVLAANLEREKIARLKIAKTLEPRTVTDEQAKVLSLSLESYRGESVSVEAFNPDTETILFAQRLSIVLKTSVGLNADFRGVNQSSLASTGISIVAGRNKSSLATALANALQSSGISPKLPEVTIAVDVVGDDVLRLEVFPKY